MESCSPEMGFMKEVEVGKIDVRVRAFQELGLR
jgi:hypothetical protein